MTVRLVERAVKVCPVAAVAPQVLITLMILGEGPAVVFAWNVLQTLIVRALWGTPIAYKTNVSVNTTQTAPSLPGLMATQTAATAGADKAANTVA